MTCPLLQIIQLLKKNQEDLFELLKKKDLEIAEYVLEGGNITNSLYIIFKLSHIKFVCVVYSNIYLFFFI